MLKAWRSHAAGRHGWQAADRHKAGAALVAALLAALTGCLSSGPPERTPSVVGVVIESAENTNGAWRYVLESGEPVEIDTDDTDRLAGARGGGVAALLFYDDGADPWYFTLEEFAPDELPGCFWWQAVGVDDETHIVFENGLRVPKSADFDGQGWPQDGRYDLEVSGGDVAPFCMNRRGEVTEYRAQP